MCNCNYSMELSRMGAFIPIGSPPGFIIYWWEKIPRTGWALSNFFLIIYTSRWHRGTSSFFCPSWPKQPGARVDPLCWHNRCSRAAVVGLLRSRERGVQGLHHLRSSYHGWGNRRPKWIGGTIPDTSDSLFGSPLQFDLVPQFSNNYPNRNIPIPEPVSVDYTQLQLSDIGTSLSNSFPRRCSMLW